MLRSQVLSYFRVAPRSLAGAVALLAIPCCLAQTGSTAKPAGPWSDKSLSPDRRADLIVQELTLDEKIQLVHGVDLGSLGANSPVLARSNGGGGFVPGIERFGLPDLTMVDGALGVARGSHRGRYSTAFPSSLALASGWSLPLAREVGTAIGREFADQGYNVSCGGGVNVAREARNGRNFEYLGEDPILAGSMIAEWLQGVQAQGVIGDIKHYAVNDQETGRHFVNAVIDRRALRETDLLAFEIGVKRGQPGMVMCSYNLINGDWGCENDYLLNQVLKREWGFQGWVISDWGATHSTAKAANAGLDQEQSDGQYFSAALKKAVESGEVPMARLDDMVHRILRTEFARGLVDDPQPTRAPDALAGLRLAQRAAEESMVLLKNGHGLLPLNAAAVKAIAVIGGFADAGVLSGGGSAQVDPAGGNPLQDPSRRNAPGAMHRRVVFHRSPPLDAIRQAAPAAKVVFDSGIDADRAAAAARAADVAIVFVLQHTHEGEDVNSLALPNGQDALVAKVAAANPRTIVVIESGAAVLTPWARQVGAILEAWYPGIRGGEAVANVLFGNVNPSGKLAVTFPASDADLPHPALPVLPAGTPEARAAALVGNLPFGAPYDEGLKLGYKWFDAEKKKPAFPFGFGLSYTAFAYSGLKAAGGASLAVSFVVRNSGLRAGQEVAQVYLSFPAAAGEPPKRLIGWQKVSLAAGGSKTVSLTIDPLYVSVFDVAANRWRIVPGDYQVMAGPSSAALPLSSAVKLDGDK